MPYSGDHQISVLDSEQEEQAQTSRKIDTPNNSRFPPGVRFSPHDHELIIDYLWKKVNQKPLPDDGIKAVTLYQQNPADLTAQYVAIGDNKWYFFTPRDRKYPNGTRPNRAVGDGSGYWKATGADKPVVDFKDKVVGLRKALVFYVGKPPRGEKTNWIMHEFRVLGPPRIKESKHDMKLDDWVLCSIYKKEPSAKGKKSIAQDQMVTDEGEKDEVFCEAQEEPIPTPNLAATFSLGNASSVNYGNDMAGGSSTYNNYIEAPQYPRMAQSMADYIMHPDTFASSNPPPTLDCVARPLASRAPQFHLNSQMLDPATPVFWDSEPSTRHEGASTRNRYIMHQDIFTSSNPPPTLNCVAARPLAGIAPPFQLNSQMWDSASPVFWDSEPSTRHGGASTRNGYIMHQDIFTSSNPPPTLDCVAARPLSSIAPPLHLNSQMWNPASPVFWDSEPSTRHGGASTRNGYIMHQDIFTSSNPQPTLDCVVARPLAGIAPPFHLNSQMLNPASPVFWDSEPSTRHGGASTRNGYIMHQDIFTPSNPPPTLDCVAARPLACIAPPFHLDNNYFQEDISDVFDVDGLFSHNPPPGSQ